MRKYRWMIRMFCLQITTSLTMACYSADELSYLKNEMPYVKARKQLIKHGWKPFSFGVTKEEELSACLTRVGKQICELVNRDNFDPFCMKVLRICKSFPEYGTWTPEGYALIVMEDANKKQLFVSLYGNGDIDPSELYVIGWRFDVWK